MHPIAAGKLLGDYAHHFEQKDWRYSRDLHGLKQIVFEQDDSKQQRVRKVWGFLKGEYADTFKTLGMRVSLRRRLGIARLMLRAEQHLPDGTLNGSIITFWEEDGEYIQMVQPSVGALVAEFLIDNPNHPDAIRIANEIGRIHSDYNARLTNG